MSASSEHSGIHKASAGQHGSIILIHLSIQAVGLFGVIVQRSVHDCPDICCFILMLSRHMDQNEGIIVYTVKLRFILFHHRGIHIMIKLFYCLSIIHCTASIHYACGFSGP